MSNYKNQIDELNAFVKTTLKPSPIHGVGVFTLCRVHKGQRLYADNAPQVYNLPLREFNNLFPHVRMHLKSQWPQIVNGSPFAFPTTRLQAWMNHSEEPNYDAVADIALRDIEAGEEVTENYRLIPNSETIFPFLTESMV